MDNSVEACHDNGWWRHMSISQVPAAKSYISLVIISTLKKRLTKHSKSILCHNNHLKKCLFVTKSIYSTWVYWNIVLYMGILKTCTLLLHFWYDTQNLVSNINSQDHTPAPSPVRSSSQGAERWVSWRASSAVPQHLTWTCLLQQSTLTGRSPPARNIPGQTQSNKFKIHTHFFILNGKSFKYAFSRRWEPSDCCIS